MQNPLRCRREFEKSASWKKLETLYQQGKNEKNKTDEKKPEGSNGQDAEGAKFGKQTKYAKGNGDPEGNHFRRCKFHLILLRK